MSLRVLLSVYGPVSALGGALFIAAPGGLLGMFGAPVTDMTSYLATMFGGAAVGLGIMCWMARNAGPSDARRALVVGVTVVNGFWFALTLVAAVSANFNVWGWVPVVGYGLWTAWFVAAGVVGRAQPAAGVAG